MKQNKHLFNAFLMASISCLIFIGCNWINDLNAERVAQDDKSSTCSSINSNANVSECTKTEFKVTLNDAKNLLKSLSNSVHAEIRPIERGRDTLLYLVTTDNGWMDESEYYDSFDAIRARYNVNSEYDYITEDGGSYTSEYLRMNWGWSGKDDDVFISPGLSDSWIVESYNYKYNKRINYDFR